MDDKRIAELRELAAKYDYDSSDVGFVAAAIPELLDEVKRLQAERDQWESAAIVSLHNEKERLRAQLARARAWVEEFLHAFYEHSKLANDELDKYDAAVQGEQDAE